MQARGGAVLWRVSTVAAWLGAVLRDLTSWASLLKWGLKVAKVKLVLLQSNAPRMCLW